MPGVGSIDGLALLTVMFALAAAAAVVIRARPKFGVLAIVLVIAFVPTWISVSFLITWSAQIAVGAVVLVGLWGVVGVPLRPFDGVVLLVLGSVVVCSLAGYIQREQAVAALVGWGVPYAVGRLCSATVDEGWTSTCIAIVFTAVAVLALVEFATSTNLFVDVGPSNAAHSGWGTLQERGGVLRAEGAFGHSIALGACLAMSVPFVWASKFRSWAKAAALALVGAASVVTFSRIGMGCTAFALVLSLSFLGGHASRAFRAVTATLAVIGGTIAASIAGQVFSDAGGEAAGSADYRGNLLSLLPNVTWLGTSDALQRNTAGDKSYGAFGSIDSALILVGLNYGWIPLLLLVAGAVMAVVALVRGRRTAALVAVVAVFPALTSVAFITQFTVFFWFVAGLAAAVPVRGAPTDAATTEVPRGGALAVGAGHQQHPHRTSPRAPVQLPAPGGSIADV